MKLSVPSKKTRMFLLLSLLFVILVPTIWSSFTDVPGGYWAYAAITRFADLHITSGCGGGNYCPEDYVTRAQMAVFMTNLLKAWTTNNAITPIMNIDHQGAGDAIQGKSLSGIGVTAISQDYFGLYANSTNNYAALFDNTVEIGSTSWHGLTIDNTNWAGVYVANSGYDGFQVSTAGRHGFHVTTAAEHGLFVENATMDGVRGVQSGTSSGDNVYGGVHGYSTGGFNYGVLGQDGSGVDNGYGLRTIKYPPTNVNPSGDARISDDLYVDGTCTGCKSDYMAKNTDSTALEPGDIVVIRGVEKADATLSGQRPLLTVQRIGQNDTGTPLLAVVIEGAPPKNDTGLQNNGTTLTHIPPDGYLIVSTRGGMVQMKIDEAEDFVDFGDALTASAQPGFAKKARPVSIGDVQFYAPGTVLGRSLQDYPDKDGRVWALLSWQ